MSCSPSELRDYFFGELGTEERRAVEQHIVACAGCRDELNTLTLTRSALLSVADEEPPRRIAFVSDKVFEPRWWQRIWMSGPQIGFVSSCVLAAAIVMHGFAARPADRPVQTAVAPVDNARMDAEVARRVDAAVTKAVAAAQTEQAAKIMGFVNARLNETARQRRADLLAVGEYLERVQKQVGLVRHTAYYGSPGATQ
jgi:anti-sigma factor RsiW